MKHTYQTHFKKMKQNKAKFEVKENKLKRADNIKPQRKKRKSLPLSSIIGCLFLVGGSWYGYNYSDEIENAFSKVEIQLFGSAIAQNTSTNTAKNVSPAGTKQEQFSSEKSLAKKTDNINFQNMTPEELALFRSLEERKRQLDAREGEIKKLEEELHKQKMELDKKLAQLDQLRGQIGNQLEERVKTDSEQVDKLVAFYSGMKPQKAAKIMETINEDLAIEVLKKMKKKEASEIMNMLEPAKAQKLSERFAGYRK